MTSQRYSDDRLSICQEIAEGLKVRGYWVPKDYAGPDLINAIFKALDKERHRNDGGSI